MALLSPILSLNTPIGTIDFLGFEQPQSVTFGKEQQSYKHILIGGGRVIDLLGAGDPDITFSGYFTGEGGTLRAQFLESVVNTSQQLTLTATQFIKQVVVTKFTYGFHAVFPIAYTITLQVVQDKTQPVSFAVPGDLTTTITESLIQAADIASFVHDKNVQSTLALALIAAEQASPFSSATTAAVAAALSAAQGALTAVNSAKSVVETGLFGSL